MISCSQKLRSLNFGTNGQSQSEFNKCLRNEITAHSKRFKKQPSLKYWKNLSYLCKSRDLCFCSFVVISFCNFLIFVIL